MRDHLLLTTYPLSCEKNCEINYVNNKVWTQSWNLMGRLKECMHLQMNQHVYPLANKRKFNFLLSSALEFLIYVRTPNH